MFLNASILIQCFLIFFCFHILLVDSNQPWIFLGFVAMLSYYHFVSFVPTVWFYNTCNRFTKHFIIDPLAIIDGIKCYHRCCRFTKYFLLVTADNFDLCLRPQFLFHDFVLWDLLDLFIKQVFNIRIPHEALSWVHCITVSHAMLEMYDHHWNMFDKFKQEFILKWNYPNL